VASSKNIKLFSLIDDVDQGEQIRISPEESEIATITPDDLKILGFYTTKREARNIIVALETVDNLVDFNSLHINKKPPGDDFDYEFKQFIEVVQRKCNIDPIQKLSVVFDTQEYSYAVAMRQSGHIDFYFNF
jgi:hypothetical protein